MKKIFAICLAAGYMLAAGFNTSAQKIKEKRPVLKAEFRNVGNDKKVVSDALINVHPLNLAPDALFTEIARVINEEHEDAGIPGATNQNVASMIKHSHVVQLPAGSEVRIAHLRTDGSWGYDIRKVHTGEQFLAWGGIPGEGDVEIFLMSTYCMNPVILLRKPAEAKPEADKAEDLADAGSFEEAPDTNVVIVKVKRDNKPVLEQTEEAKEDWPPYPKASPYAQMMIVQHYGVTSGGYVEPTFWQPASPVYYNEAPLCEIHHMNHLCTLGGILWSSLGFYYNHSTYYGYMGAYNRYFSTHNGSDRCQPYPRKHFKDCDNGYNRPRESSGSNSDFSFNNSGHRRGR